MPDLDPSSLTSSSSSLALIPSPNYVKPFSGQTQNSLAFETLNPNSIWDNQDKVEDCGKCEGNSNGDGCNGIRVFKLCRDGERLTKKSLEEYVKDWVQRRIDAGISESKSYLPFLVHAPKMAECRVCRNLIYPGEEISCSIRGCQEVCHLSCAKEKLGFSSSKLFKCSQHACYLCKDKIHLWRCTRCQVASHIKCAAFPEHVIHIPNLPGQAICWRHPTNWRLERELAVPAKDIKKIFSRLPIPYIEEEFKIDINWKDMKENKLEPPPYVHIRRNIYLVKRKRVDMDADIGCTNCCSTDCADNCVCRVQSISCSKACRCTEMCTNRPFRKEKKISIVKTANCGWGVVAAESMNKGEFIIEYVGEVINDAQCEQRLWEMKYKGVKNFYMCEIRKDFTIDATFKGNSSRFLNHSCDPNCKLEKWQVERETRVGVFAARSIQVGEPLTYDYRFIQFGSEVKCYCGAPNCQGYLGSRRKISKLDLCWGLKRKRTATSCLAIIKNACC